MARPLSGGRSPRWILFPTSRHKMFSLWRASPGLLPRFVWTIHLRRAFVQELQMQEAFLEDGEMSKLTDALRELKIHNSHDLTSDGNPLIYYRAHDRGTCRVVGWHLSLKNRIFKDAPWYNNGDLTFSGDCGTGTERRAQGLVKAIEKCKELFPDLKMVQGPWRWTWVNKPDLDEALSAVNQRHLSKRILGLPEESK